MVDAGVEFADEVKTLGDTRRYCRDRGCWPAGGPGLSDRFCLGSEALADELAVVKLAVAGDEEGRRLGSAAAFGDASGFVRDDDG